MNKEQHKKIDEYQSSLDVIYSIQESKEGQPTQHRQIMLSFLRAKDDNMILLMTGLLQRIQGNKSLWTDET